MIERKLRDRYSRQMIFPQIGEEGQAKLLKSKAVIIGCGALGSNIASFLVRAGVGKVTIIDRDFIETHNLQRQVLFDENDIKKGLPKAIAAERHLKKVNSSVRVKGIVADANYTNIRKLCQGADVILDGLDNMETRLLINDVALALKIPWVYGGAVASSGMTMTIIPDESACLRCLFPRLPDRQNTATCETLGVLGTAPGIIGAFQATEAIKILVGSPNLNPGIRVLDIWQNTYYQLEVRRRDGCPACQGKYEFLEKPFDIKTTSFCGQNRAVQVVNRSVREISLDSLAKKLQEAGSVTYNKHMLRFTGGENDLVVFPDGRAIIKNTTDEVLAKELYTKYVSSL